MQSSGTRFQEIIEERAKKAVPIRVLVVDDDPSTLQLLKTALTAIDNYDVTTANCADRAIDLIEEAQKPFDCLLLDVQMPETNGIVLLRGIREIPEYADTPILMLTAMSERSYVDEAFMAGATDYITKPFDMIDLRGRMNSARRLVQERQKAESKQRAVRILRNELDRQNHFSFDDPLSITQVPNHLRFTEFNNYIDLLSRGKLFRSSVLAVKLQDALRHYDDNSYTFFRKVVQDIAYCLHVATADCDCMFSYRGSGLFLAVVHGDAALKAFPTEQQLNASFRALRGERRTLDNQLYLLTTMPESMRSLSRSAATGAIKSAIAQVETRERDLFERRREAAGPSEEAGDDSEQPRKALYEQVLHELYGDKSYLNIK
ncbi:MAG: response regulator [Roseovarius sp.]